MSLALPWDVILEKSSKYVALIDLHSLSTTCQELRSAVLELVSTWPAALQEHFWNWPQRGSNILVFGCHSAHPEVHNFYNLRLNPSPIIRFCFDNIAVDGLNGRLMGNPWSELVQANCPPQGHGRLSSGVCLLDISVFYCGGSMIAGTNENILQDRQIEDRISSVAMLFELETRTWRRLPDMSTAKCESEVCRIGSKVLVMCGREPEVFGGRCTPSRSILCFDWVHERWVTQEEHQIPPFPGEAYAGFAIGQVAEEDVLVAGGNMAGWGEYGETVEHSHQVFLLSLSSLTWTRMANLPIEFEPSTTVSRTTGFVPSKSCDHDSFKFVVYGSENRSWGYRAGVSLPLSMGKWELMPALSNESDNNPHFFADLISKKDSMIAFLNEKGGVLYAPNANELTALPFNAPLPEFTWSQSSPGMMVEQVNGEKITVFLTDASSIVSVRLQ